MPVAGRILCLAERRIYLVENLGSMRAAQGEVRMKMPARREFFAKLGAIGGLFALAAPAQAQTSAPLHQDRFLAKSRLFAGRPMTHEGRNRVL
jgi:hypothetical protein